MRFITFFFIVLSSLLLANDSIEVMKFKWEAAVARAPSYPEEAFSGRGIVIPAGGSHYLSNAYVNLHMLRDSGCTLPVEIWYIGEGEVIPKVMSELEKLNAVCKDITLHYPYPIRGFEVKIHALMASAFEEVMLLDADNVVFKDPSFLFDTSEFQTTGALFWPDVGTIHRDNSMWIILNLKPNTTRAQESGQLVINKKKCWLPLQLCLHMNKESKNYYQIVYGDKDTFHLSWSALHYPFYMNIHMPGLLKHHAQDPSYGHGAIQRDFEGNFLFCHTTMNNWAQRHNYDLLFGYYTLPNKPSYDLNDYQYEILSDFHQVCPGFEEKCLFYLKEVREML